MSESRQTDESDISRILRVIRRRLWIVVLCLVVTTGVAVLLTVRAEDRYESTSGILVTGGAEPQRNAETNLQLLSLPSVAARAAMRRPLKCDCGCVLVNQFETSRSMGGISSPVNS